MVEEGMWETEVAWFRLMTHLSLPTLETFAYRVETADCTSSWWLAPISNEGAHVLASSFPLQFASSYCRQNLVRPEDWDPAQLPEGQTGSRH